MLYVRQSRHSDTVLAATQFNQRSTDCNEVPLPCVCLGENNSFYFHLELDIEISTLNFAETDFNI